MWSSYNASLNVDNAKLFKPRAEADLSMMSGMAGVAELFDSGSAAFSCNAASPLPSAAVPQAQHLQLMCVDCGRIVSRLPRRWHDMAHEDENGVPAHWLVCLAYCLGVSCTDLEDYLLSLATRAVPVAVPHDALLLWLRQLTPPAAYHVSTFYPLFCHWVFVYSA